MINRFLFCFFLSSVTAYTSKECSEDSHPDWLCDYMETHKRNYSNRAEMKLRKSKLMAVQSAVQPHDTKVQYGLTSRSDRFFHEMKRNQPMKWNNHQLVERAIDDKHVHLGKVNLPPIDWRNHNGISYVSSVKDQGICGDCFAFASATVLEYWSARTHGHPKSISAQNLMDCTSGVHRPNVGCEGGLMEYVFEYAQKHPVVLSKEFPYIQSQRQCPKRAMISSVRVKEFKVLMRDDNPRTEDEFEAILHKYGPISVGVDSTSMDNYRGGIFRATSCSTDIDHAVTIVGYTKRAWIIKNSWGTGWGENGYLRLERGRNACGVAEYAVYIKDGEAVHTKMPTQWYKNSD